MAALDMFRRWQAKDHGQCRGATVEFGSLLDEFNFEHRTSSRARGLSFSTLKLKAYSAAKFGYDKVQSVEL
jgi:hypothetical protein